MKQPAGWYPDPSDPSRQRYFDGNAWTGNYAPVAGQPTPVVGQPSKPGMSRGMKIGLGVGAATLAVIGLGSIGNSGKNSSTSSTTITVTKTVDVSSAATQPPTVGGPKTKFDGDGTFLVGKDIAPGQYRSGGGSGGRTDCYWERQSSVGGGNRAIIASDLAEGQQIVEILPNDVAFQSKHCQPWEKIG